MLKINQPRIPWEAQKEEDRQDLCSHLLANELFQILVWDVRRRHDELSLAQDDFDNSEKMDVFIKGQKKGILLFEKTLEDLVLRMKEE
jgi:hypothetical protein